MRTWLQITICKKSSDVKGLVPHLIPALQSKDRRTLGSTVRQAWQSVNLHSVERHCLKGVTVPPTHTLKPDQSKTNKSPYKLGAVELDQWLKAHVILPEDLSSIHRTHIHLGLQSQEISDPLLTSGISNICGTQTYAGKALICII
jgi:hypothetical protein